MLIQRKKLMAFKSVFLLFSCKFPLSQLRDIRWKKIKHYRVQGFH